MVANIFGEFGLINKDGINDMAPMSAILREQTSAPFSDQLRDELAVAVV